MKTAQFRTRTRVVAGAALIAVLLWACAGPAGMLEEIEETVAAAAEGSVETPPAAPSDLEATAVSPTQIDLTWTDNSDNETEFQVQRKKADAQDWQTETAGADSTAYSDQGLSDYTEYTYRVRAVNAEGESAWTEEVSATTNPLITYTVTYDGNGADSGNAPEDSIEYPEGETVTVKDSGTLALSGNTFTNWDTKSNGNGTDYVVGSTFPMPASDVVLYAEWTTNPTYTVTYHGNGADGGTVPEDNNNYEEGDSVSVRDPNTLSLTGHDFIGWNTQEDNSGIPRNPGDEFTMGSGNVDLWAQWTEASYTLSYDGNGGGPVPSDGVYEFNEEVTVAAQGPMSRTGYTFTGWETDNGTHYDEGDIFSMPATNITLHAQWSEASYTITYDGNGKWGGSVPSSQTANYDEFVTVHENSGNLHKTASPSSFGEAQESFKFRGWNTKSNGLGEHYDAGSDAVRVTEDVTLYAEWGEYQMGEEGPSGGWIFYKKTSFTNGWRYLEAAPANEEWTEKEWGPADIDISGDDSTVAPELTGIGHGQDNTDEILPHVENDDAAKLCDSLTVTENAIEFDDWFLPSKEELHKMYENLKVHEIGGFHPDDYYWSSTEFDDGFASGEYFIHGLQNTYIKDSTFRVRAARAF